MSTVSIIVPVYNGEKVLRRCVDSILAQDYRDIEVLLIDDGSKDNSYAIMSEYAEKDPRIVAIHKENGGVSSTRNLGLEKATGKYIQFIDCDDWLPFDATKLLLRSMTENKADLVVGDFYRVVDDNVSKKGSIADGGLISRKEYAENMLLTPADFYYGVIWNKLYKKEIIDEYKVRMDNRISFCEDMIFNLEYLLHVNDIYVLKAPIYYYVKTEGSLVAQNFNLQKIVKMKTSVIKYYNDFYKNILDEADYEVRKPVIYGYLLAVSTDSFSLPFALDTKKLGQEDGEKVYFEEHYADSEQMFNYLCDHMFERLLNTVASKYKLEINDVKILYLLYTLGKGCGYDEISSLTGIPVPSCLLSITKMVTQGYVKISNPLEDVNVKCTYIPSAMDRDLQKVQFDYNTICFEGLSAEEVKKYREIKRRVVDNLRKTLVK